MATPEKTSARTLTEKVWGSDFIQSLPAKWRATLKYLRLKTPGVSNDTDPDEIGVDDVIDSQVVTGRTNELEKTTTKLDTDLTGTLVDKKTNAEKQVVTSTETLRAASVTPAVPSATQDVDVMQVGGGLAIEKVDTVPSVFDPASYSKSVPDVIPERFRVAVPIAETEHRSAGTAAAPTLTSGDLSRSEKQDTVFTKLVRLATRAGITLPVSLVGKTTNPEKQVVTVTETLKAAGSDATPTATKDVEVQNLGDGNVLQTEKDVPEVFAGKARQVGTPLVIPERFRAATGVSSNEDTISGTVPDIVSLGAGEVERGEQQQTKFTKRVKTTVFDTDATPTLHGQERNRQFGIPIPYTEDLIPENTDIGDANKEITPLSDTLALSKELDLSTLTTFLSTYALKYSGRVNVDLPDRLVSVASVIEQNSGAGASSEDGTASLSGNGSISLSLRATAQASASILPKVFAKVQPFYGNNVKCTHVHIFLLAPVVDSDITTRLATILGTAITAWPKYNPVIEEIRVVGGRFSLQVSASSQGSASVGDTGSSSSAGGGTGYSEEKGLSVEMVRISPVIHPLISLSGTLSTTQSLSASAASEAAGVGPAESISRSGSIAASVTPSTLAATVGTNTWPTTGTFLYKIDSEPFIENFVQFHCVVVAAADFPNN